MSSFLFYHSLFFDLDLIILNRHLGPNLNLFSFHLLFLMKYVIFIIFSLKVVILFCLGDLKHYFNWVYQLISLCHF